MKKAQASDISEIVSTSTKLKDELHELNNLLGGIIGNASLLLEEDVLNPEQKGRIKDLLFCADRAALVSDRIGEVVTEPRIGLASSAEAGFFVSEDRKQRKLVLVIEDEEVIRSVCKSSLEKEGFEVTLASTGVEGLRLFEQYSDSIRCVLLDLTLPYMNGNLVTAKLKASDPDVPVFLMSGYRDANVLSQSRAKAIAGFVRKPFKPTELVNAVKFSSRPALKSVL